MVLRNHKYKVLKGFRVSNHTTTHTKLQDYQSKMTIERFTSSNKIIAYFPVVELVAEKIIQIYYHEIHNNIPAIVHRIYN